MRLTVTSGSHGVIFVRVRSKLADILLIQRVVGQTFPVLRRWSAAAELRRLMRGRPGFTMTFSKIAVGASLWDYGEDDLADQALEMTDADLGHVQAIAANYEDLAYPLPMTGQHITHHHVIAFAAITYLEGKARPLNRTRRRPRKQRPGRFVPLPPNPDSGL
jgi:hypothetical protein